MRTTKPISTISYNSINFLQMQLVQLKKAHIIEFACFIPHEPDTDQTKKHIHLYIEPAKLLQTMELQEQFNEARVSPNDKPLSCINFRPSNWVDWYLYGLHDKRYLAYKGQSRNVHYTKEQFWSTDTETFEDKIFFMDTSFLTSYDKIIDAIDNGLNLVQFCQKNAIPPEQVYRYIKVWELLCSTYCFRNGRENPVDDNPKNLDYDDII